MLLVAALIRRCSWNRTVSGSSGGGRGGGGAAADGGSTLGGKNSNAISAENKKQAIVDDNTLSTNAKEINDIKAKNVCSFNDNFVEDDIEQDLRRITRGLTKINKAVNENFLGRLVWGCCSGWWPGKTKKKKNI